MIHWHFSYFPHSHGGKSPLFLRSPFLSIHHFLFVGKQRLKMQAMLLHLSPGLGFITKRSKISKHEEAYTMTWWISEIIKVSKLFNPTITSLDLIISIYGDFRHGFMPFWLILNGQLFLRFGLSEKMPDAKACWSHSSNS